MTTKGATMFGEGQSRLYNIVSVVFVTLSIVWLVFVVAQLVT